MIGNQTDIEEVLDDCGVPEDEDLRHQILLCLDLTIPTRSATPESKNYRYLQRP